MAAEAEKQYELAVRTGRGGSLLKELRHLHGSQRLKLSSAVKSPDGKSRIPRVDGKLERWCEQFEQVCNVSSMVTDYVLSKIPKVEHQREDESEAAQLAG